MFRTCTHQDVGASLEAIAAAFAIFETHQHRPGSTVLVSANSLFEEIVGQQIIECIGHSLAEFLPRYVEKQMHICFHLCLAKGAPQEAEVIVEREGTTRWWRFLASPVVPDNHGNQRMIVTMIEITEKKQLEQKLEVTRQRFEAVVQTAYDGIITIDQGQTIKMMNDAARDIFGLTKDTEGVGDALARFIPQRFRDTHSQYVDSFRHAVINVRPMQPRSSVTGLRVDGSEVPIEVTISKIRVGTEAEMTAVVRDISERTKMIEQLTVAATHDSLTGICNRRHGTAVLAAEISRCQRFSHPMTVAILDVDHFKAINDTFGHAGGDVVLTSTVTTISNTLRDSDNLCRWGGEEFLVVLPETTLDEALRWAERVREAVASEAIVGLGESSMRITVSVGLAELPSQQPSTLDELVIRADKALYRAKESGRNQVFASAAEG